MPLYQHGLVAALGVFLVVIGVVIPKLIEWQVRDALRASLSVDSTSDSGYNDWANAKAGNIYRKFLGYELTNPAQFMAGQKPNLAEWSADYEVWYDWQRIHHDSNFSDDRTQVTTRTTSTYYLRPDSPGSDQKYFLTVNWAFVALVSAAGSENALWSVLANVMLGGMFQASPITWASNTTYCIKGTICGLAKYAAAGHNIPTLNATQIGLIAAKLPTSSWLGEYATIVPVIYNPATPTATRAAYIAMANAKFTWFDFSSYATDMDPLYFVQYLSDLITNTGTTLTAAYGTTPYGLFFKNATIRDHIFAVDPLFALVGQTSAVIGNGTSVINVIKTGYGNDAYLGMDYYLETYNRWNETRYPVGSFSVEGRQGSVPPFQSRPDNFNIFFPTAMRFVRTIYGGDVDVKSIPTWHYTFDTDLLLNVSADFGITVTGAADLSYISSGAPIWATKPRLAGVDANWSSRVTGIPTPTSDGDSYINIEGVTGLGVEGAAKLLFSCYMNFTKTAFNNFNAQVGNEYIFPMFQAVDLRVIADDKANDLHKAVVYAPRVQQIVRLVLVIVGAVLLVAAIGSYIYVLLTDRDVESEADALEGVKSTDDNEMGTTADNRGEFGSVPNPLENSSDAILPKATASEGY
jgi:hypothetical protein